MEFVLSVGKSLLFVSGLMTNYAQSIREVRVPAGASHSIDVSNHEHSLAIFSACLRVNTPLNSQIDWTVRSVDSA